MLIFCADRFFDVYSLSSAFRKSTYVGYLYAQKCLLRIYPLYWLVNAAVIPIYFLVPAFGNGYETKPLEIITSLLLLPYSQVPILGVAWSLIYVVFFI